MQGKESSSVQDRSFLFSLFFRAAVQRVRIFSRIKFPGYALSSLLLQLHKVHTRVTIFMQVCTGPNFFFELGKLIAKLLANIDNLPIDNLHPFASIIVSYTLLDSLLLDSLLLSLFYLLDNSYVGLLSDTWCYLIF